MPQNLPKAHGSVKDRVCESGGYSKKTLALIKSPRFNANRMQKQPISSFSFGVLNAAVLAAGFAASLLTASADDKSPLATTVETSEPNYYTGEGVSLGGFLFPHVHAFGALGASTADEISYLANGHHDPQADLTAQALELGLSLRAEWLQGFVVYSTYSDADRNFDGDIEEAFLKIVDIPGGFELRGGRFYNRFGFQNAEHNHAWDFVNQNLVNGRLLMEGHLATEGGEITWILPTKFRSALSFSVGDARTHEHSHEEHAHSEHDHEGHDHGATFDSHEAGFYDLLYGFHYIAQIDYNDFYQNRITFSGAFGENGFGRDTYLLGAGYEFFWRENGYEAGGRYFRFRNEVIYRNFGAVSENEEHQQHDEHDYHAHDHHHDHDHHQAAVVRKTFDDFGLSSSFAYGFNEFVEAGLRFDWVSAIDEMELGERFRISPALTFSLNKERTLLARVQYDYDHFSNADEEHSVWLQVGFTWGGAEVR